MENEILQKILTKLDTMETQILETQQEMAKTQQAMLKAQTETNQRLDKLETDVAEVKKTVEETSHRVILMEQDNKLEFGGLHDHYVSLDKKTDKMQSSIDKLHEKQDKHDMHILRLDAEHQFSS